MYNMKKNNKESKVISKLLIFPLIFCLSSCNNMKNNIQLEDGNYVLQIAYELNAINSDGRDPNVSWTGDNVLIKDFRIYIEDESAKLINARIKDKFMIDDVTHYSCFYDYTEETLMEILKVEKAMKAKANKNSSFSTVKYYLVEVNKELFLIQGAVRIYELIKKE